MRYHDVLGWREKMQSALRVLALVNHEDGDGLESSSLEGTACLTGRGCLKQVRFMAL